MMLIKNTLWSGLISFIRIASDFLSTKVVAMLIGPIGVATVGAFIYKEFKDVLFQNHKLAMFFDSGLKYCFKAYTLVEIR